MIIVFWFTIAFCVAMVANHKGFSFFAWFIYALLLWPIALTHVLLAPPTQKEMDFRAYDLGKDKCLFCAEWISNEAKVCQYCHKELPENWTLEKD
jgi:hypothetical protein